MRRSDPDLRQRQRAIPPGPADRAAPAAPERGVRIQSSHHHVDRGLDAYFSPPEATAALLTIEHDKLPRTLWEPAAGDGAIVGPLRAAGCQVVATDLVD